MNLFLSRLILSSKKALPLKILTTKYIFYLPSNPHTHRPQKGHITILFLASFTFLLTIFMLRWLDLERLIKRHMVFEITRMTGFYHMQQKVNALNQVAHHNRLLLRGMMMLWEDFLTYKKELFLWSLDISPDLRHRLVRSPSAETVQKSVAHHNEMIKIQKSHQKYWNILLSRLKPLKESNEKLWKNILKPFHPTKTFWSPHIRWKTLSSEESLKEAYEMWGPGLPGLDREALPVLSSNELPILTHHIQISQHDPIFATQICVFSRRFFDDDMFKVLLKTHGLIRYTKHHILTKDWKESCGTVDIPLFFKDVLQKIGISYPDLQNEQEWKAFQNFLSLKLYPHELEPWLKSPALKDLASNYAFFKHPDEKKGVWTSVRFQISEALWRREKKTSSVIHNRPRQKAHQSGFFLFQLDHHQKKSSNWYQIWWQEKWKTVSLGLHFPHLESSSTNLSPQ